MKEYNIDLVINKTFNVRAESLQEAKELAIQKARQLMSSYNSLTIDFVEEVENDYCEFENEYEVMCFNTDGILVHEYLIEADHTPGAATAAKEFFRSDYPDETLETIRVIVGDDFEEYNV
jgi:hypothetical protein